MCSRRSPFAHIDINVYFHGTTVHSPCAGVCFHSLPVCLLLYRSAVFEEALSTTPRFVAGRVCSMQPAATHYDYVSPYLVSTGPVALWVGHCLWCHWHEAHFCGDSTPPRSALMRPRIALYKGTVSERPCVHFVCAVYLRSDLKGGLHIVRLWGVPFLDAHKLEYNVLHASVQFCFLNVQADTPIE